MTPNQKACVSPRNIYVPKETLKSLRTKMIGFDNGVCLHSVSDKACGLENRPFGCSIFPFDIISSPSGDLYWVVRSSFYQREIPKQELEEAISNIEKNIFGTKVNGEEINLLYLQKYVKYHQKHPNILLNEIGARVVREVSIPNPYQSP